MNCYERYRQAQSANTQIPLFAHHGNRIAKDNAYLGRSSQVTLLAAFGHHRTEAIHHRREGSRHRCQVRQCPNPGYHRDPISLVPADKTQYKPPNSANDPGQRACLGPGQRAAHHQIYANSPDLDL